MLNKIVIISAILLGMAVPSPAQGGARVRVGNGAQSGAHKHLKSRRPDVRVATPRQSVGRARPQRGRRIIDYGHGHYAHHHRPRFRMEKVWVPGRVSRVWVPARYEYRRGIFGWRVRVCVRDGYYKTVREPGYWDYRRVRVYPRHHHHGHHHVRKGRRGARQVIFGY